MLKKEDKELKRKDKDLVQKDEKIKELHRMLRKRAALSATVPPKKQPRQCCLLPACEQVKPLNTTCNLTDG